MTFVIDDSASRKPADATRQLLADAATPRSHHDVQRSCPLVVRHLAEEFFRKLRPPSIVQPSTLAVLHAEEPNSVVVDRRDHAVPYATNVLGSLPPIETEASMLQASGYAPAWNPRSEAFRDRWDELAQPHPRVMAGRSSRITAKDVYSPPGIVAMLDDIKHGRVLTSTASRQAQLRAQRSVEDRANASTALDRYLGRRSNSSLTGGVSGPNSVVHATPHVEASPRKPIDLRERIAASGSLAKSLNAGKSTASTFGASRTEEQQSIAHRAVVSPVRARGLLKQAAAVSQQARRRRGTQDELLGGAAPDATPPGAMSASLLSPILGVSQRTTHLDGIDGAGSIRGAPNASDIRGVYTAASSSVLRM